jgi:hypothetical protein
MDKVILKKEGFFGFSYQENASDREKELLQEAIFKGLRCKVELAPDLTLRDIMLNVERNESLKKFLSYYCWCNIDAYHKLLDGKSKKLEHISYLEVCWILEIYKNNGDDPFFYYYTTFNGVGNDPESAGTEKENANMNFVIMGSDVANVLDHPIKLTINDNIYVDMNPEYKNVSYEISLLEFLSSIYFEISFYGDPESTDKFLEEINDRVKDFEICPEEMVKMDSLIEHLDTLSDIRALVDELIECGALTGSSWEENEEIIKDHFDGDLSILDEQDSERLKIYWMERELKNLVSLIEEGKIESNKFIEIMKIINN